MSSAADRVVMNTGLKATMMRDRMLGLRLSVIEGGRDLSEVKLITPGEGNISARVDGERFIIASDRLEALNPSDVVAGVGEDEKRPSPQETLKGSALVGKKYRPLFDIPEFQKHEKSYTVLAADFVSTEEGTGVVHTAVMYGEDDYQLGKEQGLPQHHTVDDTGKFTDEVPLVAGKWFKDAEGLIKTDLEKRKLLYSREEYTHSYPHCWRCDTPLMYYARTSWYVKMSALRDELLANTRSSNLPFSCR